MTAQQIIRHYLRDLWAPFLEEFPKVILKEQLIRYIESINPHDTFSLVKFMDCYKYTSHKKVSLQSLIKWNKHFYYSLDEIIKTFQLNKQSYKDIYDFLDSNVNLHNKLEGLIEIAQVSGINPNIWTEVPDKAYDFFFNYFSIHYINVVDGFNKEVKTGTIKTYFDSFMTYKTVKPELKDMLLNRNMKIAFKRFVAANAINEPPLTEINMDPSLRTTRSMEQVRLLLDMRANRKLDINNHNYRSIKQFFLRQTIARNPSITDAQARLSNFILNAFGIPNLDDPQKKKILLN